MDSHVGSVFAGCLQECGRAPEASQLRRAQIDAGAREAAFYTAEAKYQAEQLGDMDKAQSILRMGIKALPTDAQLLAHYLVSLGTPNDDFNGLGNSSSIAELIQSRVFLKAFWLCWKRVDFCRIVESWRNGVRFNSETSLAFARNLELHNHPGTALQPIENLNQDTFEILRLRGNCLRRLEKFSQASDAFRKAFGLAEADRDKSFILNNLAEVIRESRDRAHYKDGIAYCERAIALHPHGFPYPRQHLAFFRLSSCPLDELETTVQDLRANWEVGKKTLSKTFADIADEDPKSLWRAILESWSAK